MSRNEAKIHEKTASKLNNKRCLKTELNKPKKSKNKTPNWDQKSNSILGGFAYGVPLVVQIVFVKNWLPAPLKCAQERKISENEWKMNGKWTQNGLNNSPETEKELQKSILFVTSNNAWNQSSKHWKNTKNKFK